MLKGDTSRATYKLRSPKKTLYGFLYQMEKISA